MVLSYTQISQFLACPRRYRYQYLDGWTEKETRASTLFGRAFERALAAFFMREDFAASLNHEWSRYRSKILEYSAGESWQSMLHAGVQLLNIFTQQRRVRITHPKRTLQVKIMRQLSEETSFLSYVDAIGELDGKTTVMDWKTSTRCYPLMPAGLAALDPQLVCYSWMTGIADVALIVFVRKRTPEIQYLKACVTDRQREEFGQLAAETARQILAGQFLQHSGVRYPQNACLSCAHLGLCLERPDLATHRLVRIKGEHLDWLDELDF